jgi:hypothetical protein
MRTIEQIEANRDGPILFLRDQRDILLDAARDVRERIDALRDCPEFWGQPGMMHALLGAWKLVLDDAIRRGEDSECPTSP